MKHKLVVAMAIVFTFAFAFMLTFQLTVYADEYSCDFPTEGSCCSTDVDGVVVWHWVYHPFPQKPTWEWYCNCTGLPPAGGNPCGCAMNCGQGS